MISALSPLFRLKLSFLNGMAAVAGYLLFPHHLNVLPVCAAFVGVSLLAAGGSAINQALEHTLDARMVRTRMRAVPQGVLTRRSACAFGAAAVVPGLILLAVLGGPQTVLLGALALAWYLGVYTPLKTRTSLALPAGALCGAFPPLIGWCLAGGLPLDFRIVTLAGLLFLWQVPHFWLLQRRHEADYRHADVPLFRPHGWWFLRLWLVAFCVAALLLPAFGIITRPGAVWYALFPVPIVLFALLQSERWLFSYINSFPLFVVVLLAIQK